MKQIKIAKNTETRILKQAKNVEKAYLAYAKQSEAMSKIVNPLAKKAVQVKDNDSIIKLIGLAGSRFIGKMNLYLAIEQIKQKEQKKRIIG